MSCDVAIYARLSVTREESVSIDRQVAACRRYAEARGWTVANVYTDRGVSATRNKPEDREGWRELLASPTRYEAVVVWKVDRLARRVLDFLTADQALRERKAGVVAVEDPVDMTTPQGRAFATVLAVFAELEAAATSARVKGAREHLIRSGRVVGGTVPYGWRSVPNSDGPGYVLGQDSDRIGWVRGMADRALAGDTIYSIVGWLNAESAPLPEASQKRRKRQDWAYATVERLLRNPILAGMTPYNPGRDRHRVADPTAVLRDETGMPVVDESVAILTPAERVQLLAVLDGRDSPQRRPRESAVTSPLLSGLVLCGDCKRKMHRGTTQGRPSMTCPRCFQTISRRQLDQHIVNRLLTERGGLMVLDSEVHGEQPDLTAIEAAIQDLSQQITRDGADVAALVAQIEGLKAERTTARQSGPPRTWKVTGQTVRKAWEAAGTDGERRTLLAGQLDGIYIVRGKTGRYLDPERVRLEWRGVETVGSLMEVATRA